jgi:hypothetical protein
MTPDHIIIHHSLTADSGTVSWDDIRRYHVQTLGWRAIGYQFGVEAVDAGYEVLLGRWWDEAGAHTKELDMNGRSLGVCLVGNFDETPTPPAQLALTLELVRRLQRLFRIPGEKVLGHREVGLLAGFDWRQGEYKSCPGRLFDMDAFRRALAGPPLA